MKVLDFDGKSIKIVDWSHGEVDLHLVNILYILE